MTIYSVSDAYKTAIRARTRTDQVTGTLTLTNGTVLNLDAADLMSGSLTLDNQCVTGEELAFGCAYLGQAALNLRTDLSRYAFYGAKLVLHYGLQLPGGRWETVPLGVYTVAEAERRALYVSIKAYDNILALQQKYDGTTMQGTAYALLGQIAAACGLTLGQTEAEIGALNPNAALVCQLSGTDGLSTWRECAAAVAQLVGGFAAADRAGRLVLRTFAEKPCAALTAAARSEAAVSDFACHYAALSIETDNGSFAAGRSQDTGLTMRISNMTLAEKGLPATRQQITDNLFAALQRLDYVPATVTMPGDPAFEPGDRVALPMEDGTAPEMLVTHFVWRYRGRQTLKGVGRNPYLGGTTDGATEKALRRLQNSAESKRIVYYSFTNPAELAVQTVETPAVANCLHGSGGDERYVPGAAAAGRSARHRQGTDADRAVLYKRRAGGKLCAAAAAGDGRAHAGAVLPVCVGGGRDGHAAVGAAGLRGRHGEDRALRHQGHRDRAGHGKRDAVGRHAGM